MTDSDFDKHQCPSCGIYDTERYGVEYHINGNPIELWLCNYCGADYEVEFTEPELKKVREPEGVHTDD
jgi:transposase-like protein